MIDDAKFIDFNSSRELVNTYLGNAFKMKVLYEGSVYILKFGSPIESRPDKGIGSYENSPFSEYLGSHVFDCCGVPAQRTYLGEYRGRIVVACRDFTNVPNRNISLVEFKSLENSFVSGSSSSPGRNPVLEDVERILRSHPYLAPIRSEATQRFVKTLCVDSLIGNYDRHASNWGYLLDNETGSLFDCAPVYDCGSSLSQRLSEDKMAEAARDKALLKRIALRPKMALVVDGTRQTYLDFLCGPRAPWAQKAFSEIMASLDLDRLHHVINFMPGVSDVRRAFYSALIDERIRLIARPVTERANALDDVAKGRNESLNTQALDARTAQKEMRAGKASLDARAPEVR